MVEIKSGQTITSDTIRAGQRAIRMAADEALPPWLVHGGDESHVRSGVNIFGWRDFQGAITRA